MVTLEGAYILTKVSIAAARLANEVMMSYLSNDCPTNID